MEARFDEEFERIIKGYRSKPKTVIKLFEADYTLDPIDLIQSVSDLDSEAYYEKIKSDADEKIESVVELPIFEGLSESVLESFHDFLMLCNRFAKDVSSKIEVTVYLEKGCVVVAFSTEAYVFGVGDISRLYNICQYSNDIALFTSTEQKTVISFDFDLNNKTKAAG